MSADAAVGQAAVKTEPEAAETKNGIADASPAKGNKVVTNNSNLITYKTEEKHGQPSGKTVFVLNIPTTCMFTYVDDIKELFNKYGEIKCVKRGGITVNGASKDTTLTAFVHYSNAEAAEKSLAEAGSIVGGNPISVFVLRAGPLSVVVNNMPIRMTVECLRNLLVACGPIKEAIKIPGRRTGFVEFEDEESFNKALGLNGLLMVNNTKLSIEKCGDVKKNAPKPKGKGEMKGKVGGGGGGFKRPSWGPVGSGWMGHPSRGAMSAPRFPQQMVNRSPRGAGGRGAGGAFRGGRGGSMAGGFPGGNNFGGGGNYWGMDNFQNNDGERPNKRRKQNDWIRQY